MKANQFYRLLGEPWMIRSNAPELIRFAQILGKPESFLIDLDTSEVESEIPAKPYTVEDGVAMISVDGVIGRKLGWFEKVIFGMVDLDEITYAMEQAAGDPEVREIDVMLDTPGGAAIGMVEAMGRVNEVSKEVPVTMTIDRSIAASAGYFFASAGTEIRMSDSSMVGSIGTIMASYDISKQLEAYGVRPVVSRNDEANPLKAAGYGGERITAEQKAEQDRGLNAFHQISRDALMEYRPQISPEALNGAMFTSREALDLGLVDSVF